MASLASEVSINQASEFFARFSRFGGSMRQLKKLLADDEFMRHWVQLLGGDVPDLTEPWLIHGLFSTTGHQLDRVREWNREFGWGFTDEAFAEAEKSVPAWPETQLVAVVLVPYLADKTNEDGTVTTGLERTFHELWMRAKAEQDANWRWDGYDKAGSDRLRLHKGIEHKVGLRWEVIDLGCNRNKKPMDVRNSKSSPHAGILAAAALHPNWVKSMDGDKVPYVFAPGYEVQVPDGRPWTDVPGLHFDRGNRELRLYCYWCGLYNSYWAVPSFFRE